MIRAVDHPQLGSVRDREQSARAVAAIDAATNDARSIRLGRTHVSVSNLGRVLYPTTGTTKRDVLRYYATIAPVLLPHLRGRALTLRRWPDGVDRDGFYQKHCPDGRPSWIATVEVAAGDDAGGILQCAVDDVRSLCWLANLAALELHVPLGRADEPDRPDAMVFDLDPGAGAGMLECCHVALHVRDLFDEFGLRSVVKTSGSKGLQVYVPVDRRRTTMERTRSFARAVAALLAATNPDLVVSRQLVSLRRGKVLVDWSQNHEHKTTISAYSLRGRERPTVSTPLQWSEVVDALRRGDPGILRFEPDEVVERVGVAGDLFDPVRRLRQVLPALGGA